MIVTAYNSSDSQVVIDEDGHTLGGKEWGSVDEDKDEVASAEARDLLVLFRTGLSLSSDDVSDAAKAAQKQTDSLNKGGSTPKTKTGEKDNADDSKAGVS